MMPNHMSTDIDAKFPPFSLGKPRFDQRTFSGRLRHFMDIIDPRTLFTSEAKLQRSIKFLDDFKKGQLRGDVTDQELWQAQKIKQAIIHPDTGERIYIPFRMSGYVPFGSPITVGMLLPNPTMAQIIFWQWLNQSHNACVNYSNRNASKPTPTARFVLGYTGAVTTALSIAVGLSVIIKRANALKPTMKLFVQKFVPFPASASAGVCNVLLMRNSELYEGIDVLDKENKVVGTSKVAARKALQETAVSRAFLSAPCLLIPPIIMAMLERTRLLKRNPRYHLPFNAVVCTLAFAFALPVAIALFPQYSQIQRIELEENLQNATREDTLYYNKGL